MQIGFAGALTLIFITLKLTGVIAWSWFWVLFPVLVVPVIAGCMVAFGGILYLLAIICKKLGI